MGWLGFHWPWEREAWDDPDDPDDEACDVCGRSSQACRCAMDHAMEMSSDDRCPYCSQDAAYCDCED